MITPTELNITLDDIARPLQGDRKALSKAMKAARWQFRGPKGEYVGLSSMSVLGEPAFVEQKDAQIFDGRDNPCMKFHYYSTLIGSDLACELL